MFYQQALCDKSQFPKQNYLTVQHDLVQKAWVQGVLAVDLALLPLPSQTGLIPADVPGHYYNTRTNYHSSNLSVCPGRCQQHVQSKHKGKCLHWGQSLPCLSDRRERSRACSDQKEHSRFHFPHTRQKCQLQLILQWLQICEFVSNFGSFEKNPLYLAAVSTLNSKHPRISIKQTLFLIFIVW